MGIHCTRCEGTGFLNADQIPSEVFDEDIVAILKWIEEQDSETHDVQICDCCGDDGGWGYDPGEHGYDESTFDCM